ncbi:hypothetical protein A3Q29_03585 [Providencia stuartii]|uniref:Sulfatase-modifying factor enzyme domain-containing protein n=1 Tax=Providencia stuartii TaxID=588 RepID=A0A1S1HSF4_PROST|nr:hypothetical protein A3Q29_03585 [Providencia stuartii]
MIYSPDPLRQQVEKQSNGQRTIIYSPKGQPNYVFIVPRFNLETIDKNLGSGIHPAFIVNNKAIDAFFYSCYSASLRDGELVSQPNQIPACNLDLLQFQSLAKKSGQGCHISTNAQWCALTALVNQNNYIVQGNTDYGRNYLNIDESRSRIDGLAIGSSEGTPTTRTETQWKSWHHNHQLTGISDLVGNLWEWQTGVRLHAGEIQVIPNNDAAILSGDSILDWCAIDMNTGKYITINSPNSAKYDSPIAKLDGNAGSPVISQNILNFNGDPTDSSYPAGLLDSPFRLVDTANQEHIPSLLKVLGLAPYQNKQVDDQIYLRNYGERALMRGGAWYSQASAGIDALCLSHTAKHRSMTVGARTAWLYSSYFKLQRC